MPTSEVYLLPIDQSDSLAERAVGRKQLSGTVNAAINGGNPQDALRMATEAATRYEIDGDRQGQAHTRFLAGVCYRRLNDFPASLDHHQASLDLYATVDEDCASEKAGVLRSKAVTLRMLGRDDESRRELTTALEVYRQAGDRLEEMRTLMSLANLYKQAGDLGTAQTMLYECLTYFEQAEQTPINVTDRAKVLLNIAANYSVLEDAAQAIHFAEQGIPLFEQVGDRNSLSMALSVLGAAYLGRKDYDAALPWVRRGLEIAEEVGVHWVTAMILDDLSTILMHLKRYDEARETLERCLGLNDGSGNRLIYAGHLSQMGFLYSQPDYERYDYATALDYLTHARRLAEEHNTPMFLTEVYENLTNLYERMGNFEQALEAFRAYHAADKRVFNENSDHRIQRLELEKAQKDAEIAHLRSVELAAALEEAQHLRALAEEHARTDALTGISNRRHLEESLLEEVERARRYDRPLSLAVIDIDHFKRINDGFGHAIGDAVLGHIADLMRKSCRVGSGDQIARYGGEEFVILMPETDTADARILCERMRARVEAEDWSGIAPGLGSVTVSVGVATTRGQVYGRSEEIMDPAVGTGEIDAAVLGMYEIVARADKNLYVAKQNGRNEVVAA